LRFFSFEALRLQRQHHQVRSLHTFFTISRNIKAEELHFSFISSEKKFAVKNFDLEMKPWLASKR
jgi:hypothetical protein